MAAAQHNGMARAARLQRLTGYLFHEMYFWHHAGPWGNIKQHVQPVRHFEHAETKRRLHNILHSSGLIDHLSIIKPRAATMSELSRVHHRSYLDSIAAMSADETKSVHRVGDESFFMPGGYDIAALAAGGAIAVTDAVINGSVSNGYALCRPPGHHAEPQTGMGYCIFNNIAVAAAHALDTYGLSRIAIVDYDVHHGNGTQKVFEEDDRVLFISIHQAGNYPLNSGATKEVGRGAGEGFTLNIPLPPGCGGGAYRAAFDRVIGPALDAYAPQLVLVSAGFDACYVDPLGHMMLGSEDFRYFTKSLIAAADAHCDGRLVAIHEGGYSDLYVPFCGLAVLEEMSGIKTAVEDPMWEDVSNYGWQQLQRHQEVVIEEAEEVVEFMKGKLVSKSAAAAAKAKAKVRAAAAVESKLELPNTAAASMGSK